MIFQILFVSLPHQGEILFVETMNRIVQFIFPLFHVLLVFTACAGKGEHIATEKPRIIVSTDIGGSDADDKQSFTHLLMFSDRFNIEGLVSSPGTGVGNADEMHRMIDVYALDYPKLKSAYPDLMAPEDLHRLVKKGRRGVAAWQGYDKATEGSDWIIECARRKADQPLWILVWGGLTEVAQALHDAPDIADKIRVNWIGGPNKNGVYSYCYIAENFPDLWMIEDNASYRGFIWDADIDDAYNNKYYETSIDGGGFLAEDFLDYYGGHVKMGDSPSLFYLMSDDPDDPEGSSWGGSFTHLRYSTRHVFDRPTTLQDTVPVYSVVELRLKGPDSGLTVGDVAFYVKLKMTPTAEVYYPDAGAEKPDAPRNKARKEALVAKGTYPELPAPVPLPERIKSPGREGYYAGGGEYVMRFVPKAPFVIEYETMSELPELNGIKGTFVVADGWPGKCTPDSYPLGEHWYTDRLDSVYYKHGWQGYKTVSDRRNEVLDAWTERWAVLRSDTH